METGTGIFLGCSVLALVWLFNITKDRWRWGRILFWIAAFPVVIGGLGYVGWMLYQWNENRPQPVEPVSSYWGIEFGMSTDDVFFLKGEPDRIVGEEDRQYYMYDREDMTVFTSCGKVYLVTGGQTPLYGLTEGDTLSTLLNRLGEASEVLKDEEDRQKRRYVYEEYYAAIDVVEAKIDRFWFAGDVDESCLESTKAGETP